LGDSTCSGGICLRSLCWLGWGSHILLNGDLLFLDPLLLEVGRLENGDLMDVVADTQDEADLLMLRLTLVDHIAGDLKGVAREQGSSGGIVD
jgi:hypothetical protein